MSHRSARGRSVSSRAPARGALGAQAAAMAALVLAGCLPVRAGRGLLEYPNIPIGTLSPPGDIGLEPMRFAVREQRLPSGLRVAFERAPTRGVVGVVLVVGAGGTADPAGREGLAHLVEHLGFQARGPGDAPLAKRLAQLGATYNAETGLEWTKYYEFAPEEALPALLAIAGRRLSDPLAGVDASDFALEQQVVQNELRQRNETGVYGQVAAWIHGALFPRHAYGRSVGGSTQTIAGLTLNDAREFVARHYRPDKASLLIIGDIDLDTTPDLIARVFPPELRGRPADAGPTEAAAPAEASAPQTAPVPASGPQATPASLAAAPSAASPLGSPAPAVSSPAPVSGAPGPEVTGMAGVRHARRHDVLSAAVSRPEIWVAWALPSVFDGAGAVTRILTGPAVRMAVRRAVLEDDDVLSADVEVLQHRHSTVVLCQMVLGDVRRRDAIAQRARDTFARMWRVAPLNYRTGMTSRRTLDIERQEGFQRQAIANAIFDTESFVARANDRADFLHALGSAAAYDVATGSLARVKQPDLRRHAAFYFAPGRARVLYLDPLPDRTRPPPGLTGVSLETRPMEDQPFRAAQFGDPPQPKPVPEITGARWTRLPNGLELVIVPRPQFPVVTAILGFRGGGAAMPKGMFRLVRALEDSSVTFTSNAIELHQADGEDFSADLVRAGARNLSNALAILAERVVSADATDWWVVKNQIEQFSGEPWAKDTPIMRSRRAFWRALYGDHPYGTVPTWTDLTRVRPELVRPWLARVRGPRNAILVIVGDVKARAAERLVERWFGGWVGSRDRELPSVPRVAPPAPPRQPVLVTHRPGATQAEVTIGCRLPPAPHDAPSPSYDLLADVVAGYLSTQLRATGGAAYSVSGDAAVWSGGAAHMIISTAIENRHLGEALRVMRGHWSSFARGQFDAGALSQARWTVARAQSLAFQTSLSAAAWAFQSARLRRPLDPVAEFARYRNVGQPELTRAFATCARTTVLSIMGDEPTIRAAFAQAAALPGGGTGASPARAGGAAKP